MDTNKTPRTNELMQRWENDGASRGPAFIELRDLAREIEHQNSNLLLALQAIIIETMSFPPVKPYSNDSYLPSHLIEQAVAATSGVIGYIPAVSSEVVPEQKALGLVPLNEHTRFILGSPCFTLIRLAGRLRELGYQIEKRAEDEQAVSIHWMLNQWQQHGDAWRKHAEAYLKRPKDDTVAAKGAA